MLDLKPRVKKKPLPVPFYAVIFANGKDCDAFGLEAAAANEFVMFDERLFVPGEDIRIYGRDIYFSRIPDYRGAKGGRVIYFDKCHFISAV